MARRLLVLGQLLHKGGLGFVDLMAREGHVRDQQDKTNRHGEEDGVRE